MRVLVCGGRIYENYEFLFSTLRNKTITTLIHGGATGADLLAHRYARANNIPVEIYPALWFLHGRKAGFMRNQQMLISGHPDLVIAFPGGKGTADMIRRAIQAKIPVERYG